MFCDLVGSTALSEQLDPEELREVVRAYQHTCAEAIRRYEGYIAQYLGDGVLVYFGYPNAHEDDAARAVRAGLEILTALGAQGSGNGEREQCRALQVRLGIHTGLVVVGEMGGGEKRENLALGETPNIAARVQSAAEPDSLMISAATYQLVHGFFECQNAGLHTLKGISTPLTLYRVVRENETRSRFAATLGKGLTPLVGREEELGLLRRRWEQAKAGAGQVVMLSGEPGIGKSRLAETLKEQARQEGALTIELRCSPYHQNSAFYPIIEHVQQALQFGRDESPQEKLHKLAVGAQHAASREADALPLLAALLSLPHPEGYPLLAFSPQKQKQKTHDALVAWLVKETEKTPVYCVWEDVHWADPSSLEVLTQLMAQVPSTRLLLLATFRPEFLPSWGVRSYVSQLTLSRLERAAVEAMVRQVNTGKSLPPEVLQQIVTKTDGVPLFVEELTKTVMESVGAQPAASLPLVIPATLHDALMARLDRLGSAKAVTQLGATIGREFSYELLQAVSPRDEAIVQPELRQLVEAEVVYQRGLPPQATYTFKHALIQDTAYQSLLKSRRQQLHQQIAQVLTERFPAMQETQPELLAHHYTEAGLTEQAISYWRQAGEQAIQRSAYEEASVHFAKGLAGIKALPNTLERTHLDLALQLALSNSLMAVKGYATPEVEQAYSQALALCRRLGAPPQLFPVLVGLWRFYITQARHTTALELGEQCLSLAQSTDNPVRLLGAYQAIGIARFYLGELPQAQTDLELAMTLYNPERRYFHASRSGQDPGVACLGHLAWTLWALGYPNQALEKSCRAFTLAREVSHPLSLAQAFIAALRLHQHRREEQLVFEQSQSLLSLAIEHKFAFPLAWGTFMRGWAFAELDQMARGTHQMHEGLAALRATGAETSRPYYLACLAETYRKMGQYEEGLKMLAEAIEQVNKTQERDSEAELYRLKGELTLQSHVENHKSKVEEA
jgi:predicted ATPase/class 3 adenylate cyclase